MASVRIALCYHGMLGSRKGAGGLGKTIMPEECFDSIREHIISKNDEVDIFVHSWSVEYKDQILRTLVPKKYVIEQQKSFPSAITHKTFKWTPLGLKAWIARYIRKSLDSSLEADRLRALERHYSRWYSAKQSLNLKAEYEKESGFKYDFVMLIRFDLEFYTDLVFSEYDNKFFYASNWNDLPRKENNYILSYSNNYLNSGFLDLWFFSNSVYMDKFAELYDNIELYSASPHFASFEHVSKVIGVNQIRYSLFRWEDFEMIRAKKYGVLPPHGSISTCGLIKKKLFRIK